MSRQAEIARNLARVSERVAAACARVGRDPAGVTVIAVTKTFPAADVLHLAALGQRDVGENREQEARAKHDELAGGAAAPAAGSLRWHFVGQVQTNKARGLAGFVDVVHSVDRPRLVSALSAGAGQAGRSLEVFIEVALDSQPGRGGVAPSGVAALADAITAAPGLHLSGLMGLAPLGQAPEPAFQALADLSGRLSATHPQARAISAGMSGDFEAAIAAGATHIRIGTALLGSRTPPVG